MAPDLTAEERLVLDRIADGRRGDGEKAFLAQLVQRIIAAMERQDEYNAEQRERQ